jgi:hypothetical protein
MSRPRFKRPSLGTVLGLTALVVAVVGTANASSTRTIVRKGDIAKGAVTAKALAPSAVHAKAIAKGAVTANALGNEAVTTKAIKGGAVTAAALAADAVTASAISPGSVYGGALGPVVVHTVPIADLDEAADLSTWTTSGAGTALCAPGERLLAGGVVVTSPGNRRIGITEALPFTNSNASGYVGQITSDSGGTAAAEVQAICLK